MGPVTRLTKELAERVVYSSGVEFVNDREVLRLSNEDIRRAYALLLRAGEITTNGVRVTRVSDGKDCGGCWPELRWYLIEIGLLRN